MSIRSLRTFLAVVREGTFAGAAKEIGLTQAAVSMQMRSLETELDRPLFDRVGRAVVLNSAGRNLVATAEQIVRLYDDMTRSAGGTDLGGLLHVGAVPPSIAWLLPEALSTLRSSYPRLDVSVMSGVSEDLARKVGRGELDAALVSDPPEPLPRGLILHPILREPLVYIAPSDLPTASVSAALVEEPFIWLSRHSWTGRYIEQTLRRHDIKVKTVMELDTPDGIAEMVARGFGVSIIPLYDAKWLHDERLSIWRFSRPVLERGIGLLERRSHAHAPLTAALLDHLVRVNRSGRRRAAIPITSLF